MVIITVCMKRLFIFDLPGSPVYVQKIIGTGNIKVVTSKTHFQIFNNFL